MRKPPRLLYILPLAALLQGAEFSPTELDFGIRGQHETVRQSVTLVNSSASSLDILDLQSDCGCAIVQTTTRRLAAGERGALEIELQTRDVRGPLTRQVVVTTSQGRLILPVRAIVNPYREWAVDPLSVHFSPADSSAKQEVGISLRHPTARVTGAWTAASWLSVQVESPTAIRVTRKAGATAGALQGVVKVQSDDGELTIPVTALVRSGLELSPNPVMMGTTRQGQAKSARVSLTGWTRDGSPRILLPEGHAAVSGVEGGRYYFDITLPATTPGLVTSELSVFDGDAAHPVLRAPVLLRVLPLN